MQSYFLHLHLLQTLTLEEKQRLAQQQEQQRRFKEQKPITMATSKASPVAKTQPKDLSASLMNSSPIGQPRMMGNQGMMGQQQSLNSNVMGFSQSGLTSTGGFPSYSGVGSMGHMQGSSGSRPASGTNSKQSFDLSAFDSLLPSASQPKMSLNQMNSSQSQGASFPMNNSSFNSMNSMANQPMRPQTMSGSSMMPGQPGMMGNHGFMGNQGMMGNQGLMGNQGFMGQPGMMRQPTPMMQGQFNTSMNSMNFPQSQGSSNATQSNITNNDISDIFG